jgi:hypothetical protein
MLLNPFFANTSISHMVTSMNGGLPSTMFWGLIIMTTSSHQHLKSTTALLAGEILRRSCRLMGACMLFTLITLSITPAIIFLEIYLKIPSLAAFASYCDAYTVSWCLSLLLYLKEHTHILVFPQFGLILHVRPSLFQGHHYSNLTWGNRSLLLFATHASLWLYEAAKRCAKNAQGEELMETKAVHQVMGTLCNFWEFHTRKMVVNAVGLALK